MVFSQTVPELQVHDVQKAQTYYHDRLGFKIAWHNEGGRIGAVAQGNCAIFLREDEWEITPCVH